MDQENKIVPERERSEFNWYYLPPTRDNQKETEGNKIVDRKRKRRGFDWYYLPPTTTTTRDDHKQIRIRSAAAAGEEEEEEGKKKKEYYRRRWSELPGHILEQVLARLTWPRDLVCFGRVCRPWRSVREGFPPPPRSACPWLVYCGDSRTSGIAVGGGVSVDASAEKFVFYSLAGGDGCGVRGGMVVVELPGTRGAHIRGCSHGWLLFAYSETAAPHFLLNPATDARIRLPLWVVGAGGGRRRRSAASPAVLSSSPVDGPSCVVAFLADGLLVFCRIGGRVWQAVSTGAPYEAMYESDGSSIVAHDGKIYFLTQQQRMLGVFDPNADEPKVSLTWLIDGLPLGYFWSCCYLVESCGQVLLVLLSALTSVAVLKLDLRNRAWVDVTEEGLSNRMTFVACGSSLSVCASSLAGSECMPGYVYLSSPLVQCEDFEKIEMGGKEIYRVRPIGGSKILGLPFTEASHWFVPSFLE